MARLGSFDSAALAQTWFDRTAVAEGWFDPSLIDVPASGLSAAINQASETGTAQAVARVKTKAIGQAVETGTAQVITRLTGHTMAVGQATEGDTAQAVTRVKTRAIGQGAESDSAQAIARVKAAAVGMASETDAAQAITRAAAAQVVAIGQAGETDEALALTAVITPTTSARPAPGGVPLRILTRHRRAVARFFYEDEQYGRPRATPPAPPVTITAPVRRTVKARPDIAPAESFVRCRAHALAFAHVRPRAARVIDLEEARQAAQHAVAKRGLPSRALLAAFLENVA